MIPRLKNLIARALAWNTKRTRSMELHGQQWVRACEARLPLFLRGEWSDHHRAIWVLVLLFGFALSWAVAGRVLNEEKNRAFWVQAELDAGDARPELELRRGGIKAPGAEDFAWTGSRTQTAVRISLPEDGAVRITRLEVNDRELSSQQVELTPRWVRDERGYLVGSGVLFLPGTARQITLVCESDIALTASVEAENAATRVTINPGTDSKVTLSLLTDSAWFLLPVSGAPDVTITASAVVHDHVRAVRVFGAQLETSDATRPLDFIIKGPPNPTGLRRLAVALCLFGLCFFSLWAAAQWGRLQRHALVAPRLTLTACGDWLARKTRGWTFSSVLLMVGLSLSLWHLLWLGAMDVQWTNDSRNYYAMGHELAAHYDFDVISTYRSPGYPTFIAGSISLLGLGLRNVIVLQHVILVMHGLLVAAWFYRHCSAVAAVIAGFSCGAVPLIATCANIVWTESLYASLTCSALVVMLWRPLRYFHFVVAGILIGAAAMVRPTGVFLLYIAVGCIAFAGWGRFRNVSVFRSTCTNLVGLLAGFLLLASPWMSYFRSRTGDLGLSSAGNFTLWANAFIQGRANDAHAAINRPFALLLSQPLNAQYGGRDVFNFAAKAKAAGFNLGEFFYRAAYSASRRQDPRRVAHQTMATAGYIITLDSRPSRQAPEMFIYPEIHWMLDALHGTPVETFDTPDYSDRHMLQLAHAKMDRRSIAFRLCWRTAMTCLAFWPLWLFAGVTGLLLSTWRNPSLLPILGWIGFCILAPIAITMPAERYAIVVEPLLYFGVVLGGYRLLCLRSPTAKLSAMSASEPRPGSST
jgi:hypothetical protein